MVNVAQLVEPRIVVPVVVGSSPIVHPTKVQNMLIIISGPSGVGKGTLIRYVLSRQPTVCLSVSATTRPPRTEDVDGKTYHFLSDDAFDQYVNDDAFLEWCTVHTARYGTLRHDVQTKQTTFDAVIVEVDVQGAKKIRASYEGNQHHIFIRPPSLQTLEDRLKGRNTDDDSTIQRRLMVSKREIDHQSDYDTIITNNELTQSCIDINNIVMRLCRQGVR